MVARGKEERGWIGVFWVCAGLGVTVLWMERVDSSLCHRWNFYFTKKKRK